ncbi:hypothetical protein [Acinetobacter rudis]|uniref:Uncharacterized protein n=1 Tax=Acinetobacter rudis CIP 110305 TaxID=421052 RepID=S3MX06_9GAMM|nr:hypothetical protein [Acinetobacter rudis]EPF71982.1 hypothetical protein F945_02328 [Acinetobacter rudis CIP 110305]
MKIKYFINHLVGSFIGLCALTGIVKIIFMYGVQPYEGSFITLGVLMMIVGLLLIGYANASGAAVNKTKQTFYLHITLVTFLLITDLTFGSTNLLSAFIRNFGYWAVLQFGVYIFMQINTQRTQLISN